MKATKDYGPCAACKKPIKKGEEFAIKGGDFYHGKCAMEAGTPAADAPAATPTAQPRRRSPAQSAASPSATTPTGKPPRKRSAAKPPKGNSRTRKAPDGSQKPPKKRGKGTTQPTPPPTAAPKVWRRKAAASPQSSTKPKGRVSKTAESANGITVRLLCGQQSTDDEIVKVVKAKFPDRDETRIRSDISVNRSEINRGHYKSSREKYGLGPDAKIEKLVKVGCDRVPVSKAPAGK